MAITDRPITVDKNALYTAPAVQKLLGISRGTVSKLIKDGRLKRNLIGGKFMWTGADVLSACASLPDQRSHESLVDQRTMGAVDPSKELK